MSVDGGNLALKHSYIVVPAEVTGMIRYDSRVLYKDIMSLRQAINPKIVYMKSGFALY